MKAAQFNSYGDASVIEINPDSPKPTLKNGQILVEVTAASINVIDLKLRAGFLQQMIKISFPFTLGGDFSGKVVDLNNDVTNFKIGDEVYGQAIILNGGSGTMAEYVAANAANTAIRPKMVSLEEAGSLPLAGVSAIQALEDHINLKKGQKILIHGGAGGIGHIAIQIAKSLGAYVATTVSAKDINFVKNLGADEIIDYKTQKFEELLKEYDAVYDTVGGDTADKSFQILKNGGVIISMLGQPSKELAEKKGITSIGEMTHTDTSHLDRLTAFVDSGKIKIHIDKVFLFDKIQDAFTYQEKNHPRGKIVVKIK